MTDFSEAAITNGALIDLAKADPIARQCMLDVLADVEKMIKSGDYNAITISCAKIEMSADGLAYVDVDVYDAGNLNAVNADELEIEAG